MTSLTNAFIWLHAEVMLAGSEAWAAWSLASRLLAIPAWRPRLFTVLVKPVISSAGVTVPAMAIAKGRVPAAKGEPLIELRAPVVLLMVYAETLWELEGLFSA